jgi:hypothetical protein
MTRGGLVQANYAIFSTANATAKWLDTVQELGLHEDVLLGRRDILMVSSRCAEAPVLFAKRLRRDVD